MAVLGTQEAPVAVSVPRGADRPGVGRVRSLSLRPAGPVEDALVLDAPAWMPTASIANSVLARCLVEGESLVDSLTIGDREALLLHLRKLSMGPEMECVVRCPAPDCAEVLELALTVDELLLPPYPEAPDILEVAVEVEGSTNAVSFRLPTGADLERAAEAALTAPSAGVEELLAACVIAAHRDGVPCGVDELPVEARRAVADAMSEQDPQAELELDLHCPSCGRSFSSILDVGAYLLDELRSRAEATLRDVHALALHYGWGEREILEMPPSRRRHYLALVAEAIDRGRRR